ncbi:phosphate acetyltransferase [Sansalvadorimonas sp. 2012CJ34-2]|uniref:Phosphate acetyltransferase n=1 Tax=Parendozoicomonas callyspongiae TaxID=2942213 RepID=A0ABT0PFF7_9GAMM|nr:phosphate acetyltransferase [Sansalvadorimonas sp. 2012CJ34-2]MCL6269497.1 phosphate acetyltransferase [Sansalvadorimonas sp. 2012CJ34-2]
MHVFYITPTSYGAGLTSVALGLVRALERVGLKVRFCKPIAQQHHSHTGEESSTLFASKTLHQKPPRPISFDLVEDKLGQNRREEILEEVVSLFHQAAGRDADAIVVEGLTPTRHSPWITRFNSEMARTLSADIIIVTGADDSTPRELADHLRISADNYGSVRNPQILGYILNKMPENIAERFGTNPLELKSLPRMPAKSFPPLGHIPWNNELSSPRTKDICDHLFAKVLNEGMMETRRVIKRILCARTSANITQHLVAGALIICPGDREDIVLATCMAASNGIPLAGLLLTNGEKPPEGIMRLCQTAIATSELPVLLTDLNSYDTATRLDRMNPEVPADDVERMESVMNTVAEHINIDKLREHCGQPHQEHLTPPAFRYNLVERSRAASKRIVLPEGDEPRTIQAAALCHEKGIAQCVLLGKPELIREVARGLDIELPADLTILDPDEIRRQYIAPMVELRKHKGLNEAMAEAQLEDTVVLGTMMLAKGDVDGLVSGAVHTTANTIRPAFQLVKTKPDAGLVSSVFFMLLPDQVVVYGDCAVNPDPDADQLASIAIQSAQSAKAFGIEPKVAMISYSTGKSGHGTDVEKVREATRIAKERAPELIIDGPLQYDAAAIASVAKSKAPDSPVAGQATVFVFPDLNTGNTTYKAVQRSANVISIGPMLQGLNKPVNDLSRGALVDDIVYTIALTAIQATQ